MICTPLRGYAFNSSAENLAGDAHEPRHHRRTDPRKNWLAAASTAASRSIWGQAGAILLDGTTVSTGGGDADCTIKISPEDFEALLSGDLSPTSAFMTGRMTVTGDMSAAMALSQMI